MTKAEYSYISSSGVREILTFDGDINMLVPNEVGKQIHDFLKHKDWEPCD